MRRGLNAQHDLYVAGVIVASWNQPKSAGFPRAPIDAQKGMAGWRATPDADDAENDLLAGRRGEIPYPRTSRGKTIAYSIVPQVDWGAGLDGLDEYMDELCAAFADRSSLALVVATPWPGLPGTPGDVWGALCRVQDFTGDEAQTRGPTAAPSPWKRDDVVSLRLLDGRWLWLNESGTLFDRMAWDDVSGVDVTNNGRAPAEPLITVTAVAAGDDLHVGRNLAGGGTLDLWFRNPIAAAGLVGSHDVVIDFASHKATVEGAEINSSYDAAASTWWDEFTEGVPPGTHGIFRGPGAGTHITVELYSTSW